MKRQNSLGIVGNRRSIKRLRGFEPLEARRLLVATWDGGAGTLNWFDPENWTNDTLPQANDDVVIPDLPGEPTISITTTEVAIRSITSDEKLYIGCPRFTVEAASNLNRGAELLGVELSGNGDLTFGGIVDWFRGTMSGQGRTIIATNATLLLDRAEVELSRVLVNQGTVNTSTSTLLMSDGVFVNNGTFVADPSEKIQGLEFISNGGVNLFQNDGLFIKQGDGPTTFEAAANGVSFNNSGTIEVRAGQLNLNGGGTHSGRFHINAIRPTFSGREGLNVSGSHRFEMNSSLTGDGAFFVAGNVQFDGQLSPIGRMDIEGSIDVNSDTSGGILSLVGGTLGGAGAVEFTRRVDWLSGSMNGVGTTIIASDALLGITAGTANDRELGRVLVNNGHAVLESANTFYFSDGAIKNEGTFEVNAGSAESPSLTFVGSAGTNVFANNGTLIKSGDGAVTFLDVGAPSVTFHNGGLVELQDGTLELGTSGLHTGQFKTAERARLELTGSNAFKSLSTVTGTGTVSVRSGDTNFEAEVSAEASVSIVGGNLVVQDEAIFNGKLFLESGRLSGDGQVTVNGTVVWTGGTMEGDGETVLMPTGFLDLSGPPGLNQRWLNRALVNYGEVIVEGDGLVVLSGESTNSSFYNAGILRKRGQGGLVVETPFANSSAIDIEAGAMQISKALRLDESATIRSSPGTTLRVPGIVGSTGNATGFTPRGAIEITGNGTASVPLQLEAMGKDLGAASIGFDRNFAYGNLTLPMFSYMELIDVADNTSGEGPEALYVSELNVPAFSTLDLNGLNVYARSTQINGSVVNGTVQTIPDGGFLLPNGYVLGEIAQLGEIDEWTFFGNSGQGISLQLNPNTTPPPSPRLLSAQVTLLDPSNTIIAEQFGTVGGQPLVLEQLNLPMTGVYKVRITTATNNTDSIGFYSLANYVRNVKALALHERQHGRLETPFNLERWTFSGVENEQIQFHKVASDSDNILFRMSGPNGWTGFADINRDSELITLPLTGDYVIEAYTSGNGQGDYAIRVEVVSQTFLDFDSPIRSMINATGQVHLFSVEIGVPSPLVFIFDATTERDTVDVFLRHGLPPTRREFDQRNSNPGVQHLLSVPLASPGKWYVLVYGAAITRPLEYSLTAVANDVVVTSVSPNAVSVSDDTEVTLIGGGFVPNSRVELLSGNTSIVAASTVEVLSFDKMIAKFNTTGVAEGTYAIRVTLPSGTATTLTESLVVSQPSRTSLETRIILPAALGLNAPATLYLEYTNSGSYPLTAPLLTFRATDPSDRPLLTLDNSRLASGIWSSSSLPNGFANFVHIYASGSTPGFLRPGETSRVPIYYAGVQDPTTFTKNSIEFEVYVNEPENSASIDWDALGPSIRPESMTEETWQAIFANLRVQTGDTWGEYVSSLLANATYLKGVGRSIVDGAALFELELKKANNEMTPISVLASAIDVSVETPGLPLTFGRSFGNKLSERYSVGPFGRGWQVSWDVSLTVNPDESVVVHNSSFSRRFEADRRYPSEFISQPGDLGRLTKLSTGEYQLIESNGVVMRFLGDGRFEFTEDAIGNRISASYEASTGALITRLQHSNGALLVIDYNQAGRITSITDSNGITAIYTYDAANEHLLSVTSSTGVESYQYNQGSRVTQKHSLISIDDNAGNIRRFEYDERGRLISTSLNSNIERVTYSYREDGQVTATDLLGVAKRMYFDQNGRLLRVEEDNGNYLRFDYNALGQLVRQTDSLGRTKRYEWCSCGILLSETNELGHTTRHQLEGTHNQPSALIDSLGRSVHYTYDGMGNLTEITYTDSNRERIEYDDVGNPVTFVSRRGQHTTLDYNEAGQVTQVTYADGTLVSYQYDSHQRLASVSDAMGTTSFSYDTADRITRVAYGNGRWVEYQYNAAGLRTAIRDHSGAAISYTYNAAGRVTELRDASEQIVVSYLYDASGRISRETKGNRTYTIYVYDEVGKLESISHHRPDGTVNAKFEYDYDLTGRRIGMTTLDGTWTYSFDLAGQLIAAVFGSTNPEIADQVLSYQYDAAGNRIRMAKDEIAVDFHTNEQNQYTSSTDTVYLYDRDGNLVSEVGPHDTTVYTYDALNRLVKVATDDGLWQYEYDAWGNRVAAVVDGKRKEFLIDPTGFGEVLAVYDASGLVTENYAYGNGLAAVTGDDEWFYFDYDANGSTSGISGVEGLYVNQYAYEPFGGSLSVQETIDNSFEFGGNYGVTNEDNGLHFMRARFYSSEQGRFVSADPLRTAFDTNVYRYVSNNPIELIDVNGLWALEFGVGWGSGVAGGISVAIGPCGASATVRGGIGAGGSAKIAFTDREFKDDWDVGLQGKLTVLGNHITASKSFRNAKRSRVFGTNIYDRSQQPSFASAFAGAYAKLETSWCDRPTTPRSPLPPPAHNGDGSNGGGDNGGDGGSDSHGGSRGSTPVERSRDPNDKSGAAGFGAQAFITPGTRIPYRINFENLGLGSEPPPNQPATAPAQRVEISDQLSDKLDWSSLQLSGFSFGDTAVSIPSGLQHFSATIPATYENETFDVEVALDFNAQTGLLRATFQTIDPDTLLPPSVSIGFLSPEDGTGRGQGSIEFSVKTNASLVTGTELRNVAYISFDGQTTIATNQIDPQNPSAGTDSRKEALNTIDAVQPSSQVSHLPTFSTPNILVSWGGTDDPGGSGIRAYDVFLSIDHGQYELWLNDTTETSKLLNGYSGSTYSFYTAASDNVGHREVFPQVADAFTTITLRGDADLDGDVDASDFGIWNTNRFSDHTSFETGDFNDDRIVDVTDFNIWNANKFKQAVTTADSFVRYPIRAPLPQVTAPESPLMGLTLSPAPVETMENSLLSNSTFALAPRHGKRLVLTVLPKTYPHKSSFLARRRIESEIELRAQPLSFDDAHVDEALASWELGGNGVRRHSALNLLQHYRRYSRP